MHLTITLGQAVIDSCKFSVWLRSVLACNEHVMLSVYDDYADLCFYSFLPKSVPRRNSNNNYCYNNNDSGK